MRIKLTPPPEEFIPDGSDPADPFPPGGIDGEQKGGWDPEPDVTYRKNGGGGGFIKRYIWRWWIWIWDDNLKVWIKLYPVPDNDKVTEEIVRTDEINPIDDGIINPKVYTDPKYGFKPWQPVQADPEDSGANPTHVDYEHSAGNPRNWTRMSPNVRSTDVGWRISLPGSAYDGQIARFPLDPRNPRDFAAMTLPSKNKTKVTEITTTWYGATEDAVHEYTTDQIVNDAISWRNGQNHSQAASQHGAGSLTTQGYPSSTAGFGGGYD